MNDLVRFSQGVQMATGKKRGRRPVFNARTFYPYKEELRLKLLVKKELQRYIAEAYAVAVQGETFSDDLNALSNLGENLPEDFRNEITAIGQSIARHVSNTIANSSEMIVGKPYYPPEAKADIFKTWEANFQTLCKSAESDAKKEISRIVTTAKNEGWNGKQLEKAIMGELPSKYANRAELIARTESAKLNSEVTRATYKEIGCQYYKWMSTMDERVRPDHAAMNDVICSVEDPTVYFTENPDDPLHPIQHPRTEGEMCMLHPGMDFQCRCSMVMWDPEIDGQYEVKERPEEEEPKPEEKPEEKPTELEKAKAETAKAEERAERAEERANEAERRNEILRAANERHAKRTVSESDNIREKWRKHWVNQDLAQRGHGKDYINNIFEIEKNIGVKYTGEMTHEQADTGYVNPNYAKERKFKINCQSCVITYELRRRGFKIESLGRVNRLQDIIAGDANVAWIDPKTGAKVEYNHGGRKRYVYSKNFFKNNVRIKEIDGYTQNEGRYSIGMVWKTKIGGAHIINAERKNGILSFYDSQCDKLMDLETFKKDYIVDMSKSYSLGIIKMDELLLNTNLDFKEVLKSI